MWVEGRVIKRIDWNKQLFSLQIEADIAPFVAGQFIKLSELQQGKRVALAYSLVTPPGADYLEVLAIKVEEGTLSPNLHNLDVGDTIEVSSAAAGFLVLDEVPAAEHLWLMATGTGIGPYLSMLATDQPWQRFDKVVVVYGVRYARDLAYLEVLEQYLKRYPQQFALQTLVTRENYAGALAKRIPEAIDDGSLEKAVGLSLSAECSQVMLCGNPEMITAAVQSLEGKGLSKNLRRKPGQITVERYW